MMPDREVYSGLPGNSIEAVLPITVADADRAWILLRTLEKFGGVVSRLWVIGRSSELERLREKCASTLETVFLSDEEVVPTLGGYNRFKHRFGSLANLYYGRGMRGWYTQQMLKLGIARRVGTSYYLVLDGDVIMTRSLRIGDLFQNGKGIWQRGHTTKLAKWNDWASRVTGFPRSEWVSGVTPALFSKDAVCAMLDYLGRERASGMERLIAKLTGLPAQRMWEWVLIRRLPWTEFAVYSSFLEGSGTFDRYHWDAGDIGLYDTRLGVWADEAWDNWRPEDVFSPRNPGWFTVVQSFIGPSSIEVWNRIQPYLNQIGADD